MTTTRCVIYSRFSTDRQNESSIADQVRVCTEYAARAGWQVIERYSDAGISGAAMGNRPGFLRMREDAMAGRFNILLLTDTTRLARSQELAPLIERLRYQGARVVGVQDSFDSDAGTADMQAGLSGIMSVEFRRMIKARTHAALESRAKAEKPTGGRAYGYRDGAIDEREAAIVREIFEEYAIGGTHRTIAIDLNRRHVPAPRSREGWHATGVRVILRNERYIGRVHWNQSEWRKDPDTGARHRILRPRSEWISHTDASQRIVTDELWSRVQQRTKPLRGNDRRLTSGGKPRYLLSGLMFCAECGRPYTVANGYGYGCAGFHQVKRCENNVYVNRKTAEERILGPIRAELLAPARVERMAEEMRRHYRERVRSIQARAIEAPQELRELTARIERLQARLKAGDPDMPPDEISLAIERAQAKRLDLEAKRPESRDAHRIADFLPRAAELYRKQIADGLDGDPREAGKARVILRELLGRINLRRDGKALYAEYTLKPEALLQVVGLKRLGSAHMEVRICHSSGKNLSSSALAR
jgi:site-specific DNA recombinase